ncbi:MAG: methyltransferase, CheR-type [Chlamydiales bacterium]|jgi:chemotaxis protein methyltransferase CheR|nr:methyltransferase, CheR-type [Chlamydiales bacterium]
MEQQPKQLDSLLFKSIIEFIDSKMGTRSPQANYTTIAQSVLDRAAVLSLKSEQYFERLKISAEEQQDFFNLITINETYFFREEKQFIALEKQIFPELQARQKALKLWSVTCSTGEEAISLALLAHRFWGLNFGKSYNVYASDINTNVLNILKKGEYSQNSFRYDGQQYGNLLKELGSQHGNIWRINPEVHQRISTYQANLALDTYYQIPNDISIAFFRNTLIYISEEMRPKVIRKIVSKLAEGGYFFLSASEVPLITLPELKLLNYQNTYFFQKVNPNLTLTVSGINDKSKETKQVGAVKAIPFSNSSVEKPTSVQNDTKDLPIDWDEIITLTQLKFDKMRSSSNFVANQTSFVAQNQADHYHEVSDILLQALIHIDKAELAEARQKIDTWEVRKLKSEWADYLRGFTYMMENNNNEAVKFFKKANSANSEFWPAHFCLGRLLKETNPKQAYTEFLACLTKLKKHIQQKKPSYRILLENFNENYCIELCQQWIDKLKDQA